MEVKVLKAFTAYPDGKKTAYAVGKAEISQEYIDESNLDGKGLIAKPKKKPKA